MTAPLGLLMNSGVCQSGSLPLVNNSFIVADYNLRSIYQVDEASGTICQLLPFGVAAGPTGLAYDPTTECVYWTDCNARTINRYSLRNVINTVIHRDPSNDSKCQTAVSGTNSPFPNLRRTRGNTPSTCHNNLNLRRRGIEDVVILLIEIVSYVGLYFCFWLFVLDLT